MHRWTSLLGAILLVLMLWTGGAAHATERFDCIPATAEATDHYDGGQEQGPSDPDKGVAHHHSGCGGHHVAASPNALSIELALIREAAPLAWQEIGLSGHGPDSELRPPIA
jgi:hypothetical protein